MNCLPRLFCAPLALVALLVLPLAAAVAQDLKPVAVVSFASVKENLADISYLTRIAGMEDTGTTAMLFGNALTAGIDKGRPGGLYIVPQAGDFHAVAFLPIADLKLLLQVHKEQVGEPKDVGEGILEIGTDRTAYVKEQNGWAFVAETKDHLSTLPADPMALLGDMPKGYNVAGRLLIQNIPEELRKMAIDEMKLGIERFLDSPAAQRGDLDREQVEQLMQTYVVQIETFMNEAEELTIGLGIDAEEKKTFLDVSISAREGTDLAAQMAMQQDVKSAYAGFRLPEASVVLNVATAVSEADASQAKGMLKAALAEAQKKIDDDPNLPEAKKEEAKSIIAQLFDVFEKTLSSGKLDGGAALVLLPKSLSFVAGGYVADGQMMEKALRDLVEMGKNEPNFPKVEFNAGQHGGVQLHRLTAPIPAHETDTRELLGDELEIVIGTGKESVYVSLGKDCESLLKKVIDGNSAAASKSVPPLELTVSMLPILKFYGSVDENPLIPALVEQLEDTGNDKLIIQSTAGPRSSRMRIEVQEGLIRTVGDVVKMFSAQFAELQQ